VTDAELDTVADAVAEAEVEPGVGVDVALRFSNANLVERRTSTDSMPPMSVAVACSPKRVSNRGRCAAAITRLIAVTHAVAVSCLRGAPVECVSRHVALMQSLPPPASRYLVVGHKYVILGKGR